MEKWRIVYRVENSHPDAHRMMSIGGSLVIAQGLGYAHALKAANLLLGGEFLPGDTLLYKNSVLLELEKHD